MDLTPKIQKQQWNLLELEARDMVSKLFLLLLLLVIKFSASAGQGDELIYEGFTGANFTLDGLADITPDGLLQLTNTTEQDKGHAFYPAPLQFKKSANGSAFSFSTTFVFAFVHKYYNLSGQGLAFVICPTKNLSTALPSQYLGLLNLENNGSPSNHLVAVEFDPIQSHEFEDIDNNHVGININAMKSSISATAGYYANGRFKVLNLRDKQPLQAWIEYNATVRQMNVTIAPTNLPKPDLPLLSLKIDLSTILFEHMYVGFSSATSQLLTSHYVLGWSFKMHGQAKALNISSLPPVPRVGPRKKSKILVIGLPLVGVLLLLLTLWVIVVIVRRRIKFAEILEDWEIEYGPHRFSYKDLYMSTNGFDDNELLGIGGFGRVYRGVLPCSDVEVAVKKISHDSQQGMREFVAEIATIGRLRHPNLVRLLGYCRRKGELLLVYDYMPKGSLDKFIFDEKSPLDWGQRFGIIKDVASGLLYLHEEWAQIILHRDIKASNVLLDHGFSGKLGDFGLARLYDHGTAPRTTHIVGTLGYIAPELARAGKATTATDVFAFGAFLLEIACGRRPVEPVRTSPDETLLVDWVWECYSRGNILEAADLKLGTGYVIEEMELVLQLGLLCSQHSHAGRPTMRQVKEFLNGTRALPEVSGGFNASEMLLDVEDGFRDMGISYSFPSTDSTSLAQ